MRFIKVILLYILTLIFSNCEKKSPHLVKNSSEQVNKLLEIADDFENTNIDSAYHYSKRAFDVSVKSNDKIGQIASLNNLGFSLTEMGKTTQAFDKYRSALALARSIKDSSQIAKSLNFHGVFFDTFSDYDTALAYYKESLEYREALQDSTGISIVTGNIGLDFFRMKDYKKAEKYMLKAKNIDSLLNDTLYVISSKINLALVYKHTNRIAKAIAENKEASALAQVTNNKLDLATAMANLGIIYSEQGDHKKGINHLLKAQNIRKKTNNTYYLVWSHITLMEYYQRVRKNQLALKQADSALVLNAAIKNKRLQERVLKAKANIVNALKKYQEVYPTMQAYIAVKDSLTSQARINSLAAIEVKLDVLEKDKTIAQLENKQLKATQQKLWIGFVAAVALFILGFIAFLYYRKSKKFASEISKMKTQLQVAFKDVALLKTELEKAKTEPETDNVFSKYDLSFREKDILTLVAEGNTNKEIAEALFISVNTVKFHIKNLYNKLEISKRSEVQSKILVS